MGYNTVIQVVNSGQTGVEIGSLVGAKRANIGTGGTARNNYMTHGGSKKKALIDLGLHACESSDEADCISANIVHSQACLFLTSKKYTAYHDFIIPLINAHHLPFIVIDINDLNATEIAKNFLLTVQPSNLFVTGDSDRLTPKIARKAACFIHGLLS
jgi:hypothetical protein